MPPAIIRSLNSSAEIGVIFEGVKMLPKTENVSTAHKRGRPGIAVDLR